MKEQEKSSEEELTEMEKKKRNLPNKKFKVMIVKMLKLLG